MKSFLHHFCTGFCTFFENALSIDWLRRVIKE